MMMCTRCVGRIQRTRAPEVCIDLVTDFAYSAPPRCECCGTDILSDICACGDKSDRFVLAMQRNLRYLDDKSVRLEAAATRYLYTDKTDEAAQELKRSLVLWLDARKDMR